jgi:hypothetical protein
LSKTITVFGVVITILLIAAATLALKTSGNVVGTLGNTTVATGTSVLFGDDFEGYGVGTFPYSGGWQLWFDGAGSQYQIVTDSVSSSPTRSLQLLGFDGWAAFAAKPFATDALEIGFQVSVMVANPRGGNRDDARVSFTSWTSPCTSREVAPVCFDDGGMIVSGDKILQSYVANRWYKITLVLDRPSDTYSVWVDGVLCGENLKVTTSSPPATDNPSYEIEAFSVSQCYNQVPVYFDDVEVFTSPILLLGRPAMTPATQNYNEDAAVSVAISGDAEVDRVLLSYTYDLTWKNISMTEVDGAFDAAIPSQPYGTLVQYRIYANDTNGNSYISSTYSYTVSDMFPPDIVGVNWTPEEPTANDTVKVAVNVTEPADASGISKVLFSFRDCYGQWWNTTMTYDEASGLWNVIIPQQPHNATVQFYVVAYDHAGNMAIGENNDYTVLPEFSSTIILLLALISITLTLVLAKKTSLLSSHRLST